MRLISFLILFFFSALSSVKAYQSAEIDSLETLLVSEKNDSAIAVLNYQISKAYNNISSEKSALHGLKAHDYYIEVGQPENAAYALSSVASSCINEGSYQKAIEYNLKVVTAFEKLNNLREQTNALNQIGACYYYMNLYDRAIDYWIDALHIAEKTDDKKDIARLLNNIGLIYEKQEKYNEALDYHQRALALKKTLNDELNVASSLANIGNVYFHRKEYQKAIEYYKKTVNIKKAHDEFVGLCSAIGNIGWSYYELHQFDSAEVYVNKALKIAQKEVLKYYEQEAYMKLSDINASKQDYKKAYSFLKLNNEVQDSLNKANNAKTIAELAEKYDAEKRQKEIELLTKDNQLKRVEIDNGKIRFYGMSAVVILLSSLAFAIYRGLKQKQLANDLITKQKNEIEFAHDKIAEHQKGLTDSIEYAKKIQDSILPDESLMQKILMDHFIFFRPKDVVSGDFYWVHEKKDKVFVLAADCTGHGVPGAFVSILCNNIINQVVVEKEIESASEILTEVNKGVLAALRKDGAKYKAQDGMDCALVVYNRNSKLLEFAGAMNPLIIIRDETAIQLNADRTPIGGRTTADYIFQNQTVTLNTGDFFYIFSDGYADQFGGPKGKKFKTSNFIKMLTRIAHLEIDVQKQFVANTFSEWKGNMEQIDDVLVIGIKA